MAGFSAEWLALREPVDAAARAVSITNRLSELLRAGSVGRRFFDLGCGTGANVRYLSPLIAGPQEWVLLDSDEQHLQRARELVTGCRRAGVGFEMRCLDLYRGLDAGMFGGAAVVSASALLDLVSAAWLAGLLQRCCAGNAIVLFALSYDGRIELEPREPDDEVIRSLVNRHQTTDKGFGPALGPEAVTFVCTRLEALRYQVVAARSDWVLDRTHACLQKSLLRGWARAATEIAPAEQGRCERWLNTRLGYLDRGQSAVRVGHQDVIGWPATRAPAPAIR
jgi:SAM-dependent methyltransferase